MIYLDYNATTPLHPKAKKAIQLNANRFGNPSSIHHYGRSVKEIIENTRHVLAEWLNTSPENLFFTSSGTESNNAVLKSLLNGDAAKKHLITSQIEHPSILETCRFLERHGVKVSYAPVNTDGIVDSMFIENAICSDTSLISIMLANNETGALQPIREIAAIAHRHGIPLHTDAVQAVGKIPLSLSDLNLAFLSLSGHKCYAPQGVGVLYCVDEKSFPPLIHGGGQERKKRGGTENTLGILALGASVSAMMEEYQEDSARIAELTAFFESELLGRIPDTLLNGHPTQRLPGTCNISFLGLSAQVLVMRFDLAGIAVSTGSACSTGSIEPSHVLRAMGIEKERLHSAVRFSLGKWTTKEELTDVLEHASDIVAELRHSHENHEYRS